MKFIYGAGGHGKVVLDAMYESITKCNGFIDNRDIIEWASIPVFSPNHILDLEGISIHIAIGNAQDRARLSHEFNKLKLMFFSVKHPLAVVSKQSKIGTGTFVAAHAIVAPYVTVGDHVILNHGAVIDHDSIVGNYSHIAPNVTLGGGVSIGEGVLVGSGSVVLPKISIGNNATIGAGAVVTKNVAPGTTVVGNPAKPFIK